MEMMDEAASAQGGKRILFLTTKYDPPGASTYLTNDLAAELVRQGHTVQVVVSDWSSKNIGAVEETTDEAGVKVLRLPPVKVTALGRLAGLVLKWSLSPVRTVLETRKRLRSRDFDLILVTTPTVLMTLPFRWAQSRYRAARSFAYVADFFPFHHREIGLIPNHAIFAIARFLERSTIRRFDVIGCMSPGNIAFLKAHYSLKPSQRAAVVRLWADTRLVPPNDRAALRRHYGLPEDRFLVLFGGQITQGRGIEEMLEAARLAATEAPQLFFVLIGDGRLAPMVDATVRDGPGNLVRLAPLTRETYLQVAAACDAGLVATVSGTSVPTFPSKTIDYLRAGLPVVASVEAASDYPDFVRARGFGLAVEAGDARRLLGAIQAMTADPVRARAMRDAGRATLDAEFDVKVAARKIVDEAFA